MELHRQAYEALLAQARTAQKAGLYRKAVDLALAAWEHVDGMMRYGQKYEQKDFSSIAAIDFVLRYAPLLLDMRSLDELESLLRQCKRIERETAVCLADELASARARVWENHRLWDHLEQHPDCRQDELRQVLGGDQEQWRRSAEAWESMGLVRRTPEGGSYRLVLSTRMGEVIRAKCPSCGNVTEGTKAVFLEEVPCSHCRAKALFVMLSPEVGADTKE